MFDMGYQGEPNGPSGAKGVWATVVGTSDKYHQLPYTVISPTRAIIADSDFGHMEEPFGRWVTLIRDVDGATFDGARSIVTVSDQAAVRLSAINNVYKLRLRETAGELKTAFVNAGLSVPPIKPRLLMGAQRAVVQGARTFGFGSKG